MPKSEEPSSDPNLFSQRLWKLYDACHYWVEGSSRQRAFHKDYALHRASKDLGAWFVELQAEVSDLVKLADAQYYDVVHPDSDPLPVAAQPRQSLFPPEFHEAEKEFYDIFHTMKTKLDIVATAAIRESSWLTRCKVPKCDLIVLQEMYDTARKIEDNCTSITAEHQSWNCTAFSSESDNRSLCKRINQ